MICGIRERMTQPLHTSFLEPDPVDQTFTFIIEPVLWFWILLISRRHHSLRRTLVPD